MTTIETHAQATASRDAVPQLLVGIADWVSSSDHKKIGRLFVALSWLLALATAVVAALIGLERITPSSALINSDAAPQLLAIFRFGLVYAVLAPTFVGIAVAVAPLQVGARSIAFPRVAQLGLWLWTTGVTTVIIAIAGNGGPAGGNSDMVDLYLLGLAVTAAGLVAAATSAVVTVLTARAPGMSLERAPLFSWSVLAGGFAIVASLPVAIGTIAYLYVDHTHARVAFGGNYAVNDHLGWALTQPLTFVFVVMAIGALADMGPVVSGGRQPLRGAALAGIGLVTTAVLGAVTQSQHVLTFTGGAADKVQSLVTFALFNLLPILGVLVVLALGALGAKSGKIRPNASFAITFLGVGMILVGMLGNALLNIDAADLAGTVFEEGATVYVSYGALLAGLGAISFWGPKLWGRKIADKKVFGAGALVLLGTVLAAFPQYIAGFQGQPNGAVASFEYDGPISLWNGASTVGHALVILGLLAFIGAAVTDFRSGELSGDDPWNGHTLEWATPSPAPHNNFSELATVGSAEPVLDAKGVSA
jgi:heme/copper-type cytochrome/quinol oxidase subunit 1